MSIIVALIIGAFIGWIASRIGGRNVGFFASIVVGIIGSLVGVFIPTALTGTNKSYLDLSWMGTFWSLIGSLILVVIFNTLHRQHYPHTNL